MRTSWETRNGSSPIDRPRPRMARQESTGRGRPACLVRKAMTYRVTMLRRAQQDYHAIETYLAARSRQDARSWVKRVDEAIACGRRPMRSRSSMNSFWSDDDRPKMTSGL